MTNPFDWDYLTAPLREIETFGPYSTAFFVLFVGSFLIGAVMYVVAGRWLESNPVLRRGIRNASQIIMWLTAVGLFFFSWRIMRIDFATLYMRFWTFLFSIFYAITIAYFAYWYLRIYPEKRAAIEREQQRRRYLRGQARAASRRRKARRGVR